VEEFASRPLEMRCRRRDIKVWRRAARCSDVGEFAPRALEMRCRHVDVEM